MCKQHPINNRMELFYKFQQEPTKNNAVEVLNLLHDDLAHAPEIFCDQDGETTVVALAYAKALLKIKEILKGEKHES